jgi:hypothetical protein
LRNGREYETSTAAFAVGRSAAARARESCVAVSVFATRLADTAGIRNESPIEMQRRKGAKKAKSVANPSNAEQREWRCRPLAVIFSIRAELAPLHRRSTLVTTIFV